MGPGLRLRHHGHGTPGPPSARLTPHNSQVGWEGGGNQDWSGFEICPRSEPGRGLPPRAPPGCAEQADLGSPWPRVLLPPAGASTACPQGPEAPPGTSPERPAQPQGSLVLFRTKCISLSEAEGLRGLPQNNASLSTACSLQKETLTQAEPTFPHHYSSPAWLGATPPECP